MSDNPQTTAATENTAPETGEDSGENTASAIKSLNDVQKRYFGPDKIEEGGEYYAAAAEVAKAHGQGAFVSNFDINAEMGSEKGFPEGFGLAIIPVSVRRETEEGGKNEVVSVIAAAVPTVDQIASADGGQDFIHDLVTNALMTRVANAGRPKAGQTGVPILPRTVADFMEGGKRESTKGFMEVAPAFVKLLKQKGMKNITVPMLRDIMQSKQIAEQYFPRVSQDAWIKLGKGMIQMGAKNNNDMSVLEHWLETRDEAGMKVIDDDVLSGVLDAL